MSDAFSRYDVYAVAGSLYCYKDSNILRNHFGLRDSKQLRMIESEISAARQSEMLEHPVPGRFTTTHLCNIHRKLFGDVYPFAGHLRYEAKQDFSPITKSRRSFSTCWMNCVTSSFSTTAIKIPLFSAVPTIWLS